ncbi:MAG: hypothetical protein GDA42_06990 [Ekhidna sp.]|nr:hypothetical protein [Ekhidna sp.]MBC6410190.1 hypothetical protein [Ekhidna sp.]
MDLVIHQESDVFIARKYGLDSGFVSGMKKALLEQHGYFRILETMKKEEKLGQDLAAENARLCKASERATLRVAALEALIDVAEYQLNVAIRKKPGSKPSPSWGYFILAEAWRTCANGLERADRVITKPAPLKSIGLGLILW